MYEGVFKWDDIADSTRMHRKEGNGEREGEIGKSKRHRDHWRVSENLRASNRHRKRETTNE